MQSTALTPLEVAELLRITKNTVYELIKRGELRGYRVGKKVRIETSEVEAYKLRTQNRNSDLSGGGTASKSSVEETGGFVVSGQDLSLDLLVQTVNQRLAGGRLLRSHLGSLNGLYALYQGAVQAASCHLWDPATGTYNLPYLAHVLPGVPLSVIHLAGRTVGFYVAKGNPQGLKSWLDLGRPGLRLVARETGSGARVLLDCRLQELGIDPTSLLGYDQVVTTHLAAAAAVARGAADLALGSEKVARQVPDIDFIPLQIERYDLVLRRSALTTAPGQAVVETIQAQAFQNELAGLGGYELRDSGRITNLH